MITLRSLDAMAALDVCDVAIAKLAVSERLAGRSRVDPEAPPLYGNVRPDVIDELLLRDNLTWAVGIDQNIQRPTAGGKHSTVAQEPPLANRKFERAELQLPMNYGTRNVSAKRWIFLVRMPANAAIVRAAVEWHRGRQLGWFLVGQSIARE